MLVEGGGVFMADILFDVLHKPVRENGMHDEKVFAEKAAGEGRAAAAGAVGDDHLEALIGRSGPEGGLAEAGEAVDADLRRVDHRIGFQIVEHAGEAPRPDADGRVVLMAAFEAVDVVEKRQGAAVPCGGGVGENIVVAGGYGCIATGDGFAETPEGLLRGAFVMIGFVFGNEAGAADVEFVRGELVAAEIQPREGGHGLRGVFRDVEEAVEGVFFAVVFGMDADLLADGRVVQGVLLNGKDFEGQRLRTRENAAIDVVAEEFEQFRTLVRHPVHGVFHIRHAGRKGEGFHF